MLKKLLENRILAMGWAALVFGIYQLFTLNYGSCLLLLALAIVLIYLG